MLKINELNNLKAFEKSKNAVTSLIYKRKSHCLQAEISSINNEFTLTPNHNQVIWQKQYQRLIQIAYYQAGKTVVQTLLPQHPPVSLIMLNPLGVTASTSADTYISSDLNSNTQCCASLESRLIGLYGGKAASQLFEYEYERMSSLINNKDNLFVDTFKKGTPNVPGCQDIRPDASPYRLTTLPVLRSTPCIPHTTIPYRCLPFGYAKRWYVGSKVVRSNPFGYAHGTIPSSYLLYPKGLHTKVSTNCFGRYVRGTCNNVVLMLRNTFGMGSTTFSNTSRKTVYEHGANSEKRVKMVQQLDKGTLLEYFQKRLQTLWKKRTHVGTCSPQPFALRDKGSKTSLFQNNKTTNLINESQNLITKLKNKRDVSNFFTTFVRVLSADAKTSFEKNLSFEGGACEATPWVCLPILYNMYHSVYHSEAMVHMVKGTIKDMVAPQKKVCDSGNSKTSVITLHDKPKGIVQVIEDGAESTGFTEQKRGFYHTFQRPNTECNRRFAGAGNNFFQSNIGISEIQTATRLANLLVTNWNFYSFHPKLFGEIEDVQYAKLFKQRQGNKVFPKSSYSSKRISIENVKTKQSLNVETLNLVNSFQFSNVQRDRFALGWFRLYLPDIEATSFLKNAANYFFNLGLQTLVRPSINKLNPTLCSNSCDFKFACGDRLESKTSNMFSLNNKKRPALLDCSSNKTNKNLQNSLSEVIPILPFNLKVKTAPFTCQRTLPKDSQNVFSCRKITNNLRIGLGLLRSTAKRRNQIYHGSRNKNTLLHRISLISNKIDKIKIKQKQFADLDVSSFLSLEKQINLKGFPNETILADNLETAFQDDYATLPPKTNKSVRFKGGHVEQLFNSQIYLLLHTNDIPPKVVRYGSTVGVPLMQTKMVRSTRVTGDTQEKSDMSRNHVNKASNFEKELIYHALINNSFTKAFLLINQNRQLLDYFVDYLIRFQILRQHQILYLFSTVLLNCKKSK